MFNSYYQPPSQFEIPTRESYKKTKESYNATKIIYERDPRSIALQHVEYAIDTFNSLRIYVAIGLLINFARLTNDILQISIVAPTFFVLFRSLQTLGYFFGFDVHTSKNYLRSKIFYGYLFISLLMVIGFCYESFSQENSLTLMEDVVSFIITILLINSCRKFSQLLRQRNYLKEAILESQRNEILTL